jgi:hypothetical protein
MPDISVLPRDLRWQTESAIQGGNANGQTRLLPDTPEGRLEDLIETTKAHIRSKVEHPFRVIKQRFGFQKTRLRNLAKIPCKFIVLAALTNLFVPRRQLLGTVLSRGLVCPEA